MRKYMLLKDEILFENECIKKVMICEIGKPVFLFLYTTKEDFFSFQSETFNSLSEAELFCRNLGIVRFDWIEIDDSLDFCNLDWIAPVRRKGRESGVYYGDIYEQYDGLNWVEFKPFDE